jgi:hypothetical protein
MTFPRSGCEDFVNKNYALAAARNCSVHTYARRGSVTINQTSALHKAASVTQAMSVAALAGRSSRGQQCARERADYNAA